MKPTTEFQWALAAMRDQIARSDLLPEAYAQFRPLLADGLHFFLARLAPPRLRRIMAEQVALPAAVALEERVALLLCHSPVLHKLGQMLARDRRLSSAFRHRLQRLESLAPQTGQPAALRLLESELPHWRTLGITVGRHPLAEGSVALVLPMVQESRAGVLKLLKPQVEEYLHEDLAVLGALGGFLDTDCARYHLPPLDYQDTFATIRDLLRHEVRLEQEQKHMAEARKMYAGMADVLVPELLAFCTPRLTAMERIDGEKMPHWKGSPLARAGVARATIEALVAQPIFSAQSAALFHADPHAGNLLVTPAGKVGLLDWSLVGHLRKVDRVELTQLLLGAVMCDADRMGRAIERLSLKPVNAAAVGAAVQEGLRQLRWGTPPGLTWLTAFVDRLAIGAGVKFEHNLLLFRKTLLTLEGVLTDLGGGRPVEMLLDQTVLARFLTQWAAEWPARFGTPLTARTLDTHLSTADAWSFAWSGPAAAARWWSAAGREVLHAWSPGD